jgi:general secretion pathway protein A
VLAVLDEFGVPHKPADRRLGYLRLLNRFLLDIHARGKDAVLVIDEAQDMSAKSLEAVRLLSNMETDRQKLLQIVLVGQPELREKLQRPCLRQLNQRITVRYHLEKMSREDTEQYLQYRLSVAGADARTRFDRRAARLIHRYSGGTPRLVNALGDKALLAGYVYNTHTINRKLVKLAARELDGTR